MSTDDASSAGPERRKPRRRIAQKLFLFYVLPLSVLIVAGIAVPFFLWSYFGRYVEQYEASRAFSDAVTKITRTADDAATLASVYVLSQEPSIKQQFGDTTKDYLPNFNIVDTYVEANGNQAMRDARDALRASYGEWYTTTIRLMKGKGATGQPLPAEVRSSAIRVNFVSVRKSLDTLSALAAEWERRLYAQARTAEVMRRTTSVAVPLIAVFLAFLIGRSIALGITRPLEALTLATEGLERGDERALDEGRLSASGDPEDEIGELQRAFVRMARTIGQREAMLRAQNEALGALNQRSEAVLNATNDGIALLDRAGAFSVVNQRFADLFGIEADVLLDQTFAQAAPLLLSRFKNRAAVRERMERLIRDPDATEDDTFEVVEPTPRTLRLYTAPVRGDAHAEGNAELMGRIFVFRDVTRETMVDRMKTEFVSTVSHELRTPLTAIKGYVDLMVGGQTGPLNEVQTEFLTMVQASTRRLTSLINDILDISRVEAGRMDMRHESVDYVELVQQVVRMMSREAEERNIDLRVEIAGEGASSVHPVLGDADRITQVLVNFLSNGIKYTPVGGHVTIRIESEDNFVTTCVEDDGIGISPQDQRRLFQKFFRADNSTTRETGGTGLGLAITKAILEKLNGSVWVESEVGKGSKFWFTLPTVSTSSEPEDAQQASSRHVLSIDSDHASLHRLGHELRHQGFVTANATTRTEALRRARGLRPDIITHDLLAPGLDGHDVLRALRESEATRGIAVRLVSLRVASDRAEVRDSFAFLPRPIAGETLAAHIDTAVPRGAAATILVVGDADLARAVRRCVAERDGAQVIVANSPEEADAQAPSLFPQVVILDMTAAGTTAGPWLARRKALHPGERLPVIVVVDAAVLAGDVQPLVPFGAGSLPLERIGSALRKHLTERTALVAA
jgi:PAS domain S-box-containing protein